MEFNATFLISAISFVVFVFIMNLIFYKPIENIVNKRKEFVDNNFDTAHKNNLNSDKFIKERAEKLDNANTQGKNIMDNKTLEAKQRKQQLINEAHLAASKSIQDNQKELNLAFEETNKSIINNIDDITREISSKMFGDKI